MTRMTRAELIREIKFVTKWRNLDLAGILDITETTMSTFVKGKERKVDTTRDLLAIAVRFGLLGAVIEFLSEDPVEPEIIAALNEIGRRMKKQPLRKAS